ncbi:MAG: hypothetical protein RL839_07600 [Gammaproteobacteria bacterium]
MITLVGLYTWDNRESGFEPGEEYAHHAAEKQEIEFDDCRL